MGPPLATFHRLTKHYSLKGEGRARLDEVTREEEVSQAKVELRAREEEVTQLRCQMTHQGLSF